MRYLRNEEENSEMFVGYGYELKPLIRGIKKHIKYGPYLNWPLTWEHCCYLVKEMKNYAVYGFEIQYDGLGVIYNSKELCEMTFNLKEGSDF